MKVLSLMKSTILAGVVALGATAASAATVVPSSPLNSTFSVNYSQVYTDGNPAPVNLAARSDWKLTGQTGTQWSFEVVLSNLTSLTEDGFNRLTTWGFNTTPNATAALGTITGWKLSDGNVPGLGSYEICVTAGPNCAGGSGDGLFEGNSLKFALVLTTQTPVTSLTFDSFYVRYQSVGANGESTAFTGTEVPLPAAGFLLLSALGGLAVLQRRKAAA